MMLPTTGHFKDIECPYFENGCDRPYCHFRHRKKNVESAEQVTHEEVVKTEVPTYKPTPKSQLSTRNHIPISYVPDLAVPSTRRFAIDRQITYKPTPISVLTTNKAGSSLSNDNTTDELKSENDKNSVHSSSEYNPEISLQNDNFNFEALSMEFDMIDDIISDCDKQVSSPEVEEKQFSSPELIEKEIPSPEPIKKQVSLEPDEKHRKKRDDESTKSGGSSKTKHSKESKERKESKSDSKSKKSDHRKHDKKEKSSSRHEHKSSRHKHDKHESKKEKKSDSRHNKHKHKDKDRDKSKDKKSEEKKQEKKEREKEKSPEVLPQQDELLEDSFDEGMDYDDYDYEDDSTIAECYRIFNEYKPEQAPVVDEQIKEPDKVKEDPEDNVTGKKRVAHEKADNIMPKQYTKPKDLLSAAQMMTNRFKIARLAQANNEQKNIQEELKKQALKRPLPALNMQNKIQKVHNNVKKSTTTNSTSVIDDILSGSTKPTKTYSILSNQNKTLQKRIAPVQNVSLLQKAKAKIDEIAKQNAINTLNRTTCQTTAKGNKRVAHVPEFSLSDIPDVINADKSKLPVNVRTRYLTMLADECFKLYLTKEDAYQRALSEEFKCYERCKALATYRNSSMLSVNRIRKEVQEREKLSLGPISSDETIKDTKNSELKGKKFYESITGYILSEEELILHGYPRESSVPGRAQIQTQKQPARANLDSNERICARCSKIYAVDRKGFPVQEEECIYHPLKKRTLRGERTYLCCKSTDDLGCITSNTHVCDAPLDVEVEGFQMTMQPESETDPRSYAVYALDCEMCYTTKGLELTRVTIVDTELKTVYESLVKPLNPIIDYNTRFSGITKEQMDRTSTSILQVQANILHLCNSKTILIGHSLESDMKALKIIHSTIIDTAVLFPHKFGLPHKRALRALASDYLKKIIQNDIAGHDSAEDALTCMELILWKVKEEQKVRSTK